MKRVHTQYRKIILYKTPINDFVVFINKKDATFIKYEYSKVKSKYSKLHN